MDTQRIRSMNWLSPLLWIHEVCRKNMFSYLLIIYFLHSHYLYSLCDNWTSVRARWLNAESTTKRVVRQWYSLFSIIFNTIVYFKKKLFSGEYFVIGVDIEQYDSSLPDKYLRGLLQDKSDSDAPIAFKSYLAIVPSAPVAFDAFALLVSEKQMIYAC